MRRALWVGALAVVSGLFCPAKAAQFPSSAQRAAEYRAAQAFLGKKEWADAVIALRKVVRAEPTFSGAAIDLSKALVYSGRREEALSVLAQAAERLGGSRRSELIRRGRVLSRTFLTSATFQLYQEGLSLLIAQKFRSARDRFEKGLIQEPDNVEILTRLGQCLLLENDFDSAAERLRLAKKLNSYEPQIRLWLGRALHQRGEAVTALEELRRAYGELEGSELAPIWLAEALSSNSQRPAAIKILEKNVKEQPFHLRALLELARLRLAAQTGAVPESLWSVRKELQIALSRFDQYETTAHSSLEGDLGLDIQGPKQLKSDIESLLQTVDTRLEDAAPKPKPVSADRSA